MIESMVVFVFSHCADDARSNASCNAANECEGTAKMRQMA